MTTDVGPSAGTLPLLQRRCHPVDAAGALDDEAIAALLPEVPDWRVESGYLTRVFTFADHWETMAFVNALAWVSHREDHHPELAVGYDRCQLRYTTHSAAGLSENDFICAARLDALFSL